MILKMQFITQPFFKIRIAQKKVITKCSHQLEQSHLQQFDQAI